ncbi:hypothetical protein [Kribbella catacumbae]|uniref:hypothetical protein n=1 Tax=Kribbella catacumbae TaxID=460086 RepID=UPI0003787396|nr:hypothetical protein [Kribbella catacumbae]
MSLTQGEAQERSRLLSVHRYDVAVDLTDLPAGSRVVCTSTIAFTCSDPGAETFVDCVAEIESATLNGSALPQAVDGRITLSALAADNLLIVATVTAPAEWMVLTNSGDPQIESLGATRRWTFPPTPPLSTYNLVINAGPYYELRREGAGHDLGLFARQSLASILDRDADELFTLTAQGFEFFTKVFGMRFPQRKYDQVFTPEFPGAMENSGCVTWSDWFLRRSTPTRAEWDLFARYLLITGEATAGEVVRCLTGVLAVETSESLIEPHLNRAADVAVLWSSESGRDALMAEVAATCRSLAGQVALRGFAKTAGDLEAVAWLQAEAGDDVDLQWRALVRKAQLGGDTTAEAEALLARDPDGRAPEAVHRGLSRTAPRDPRRRDDAGDDVHEAAVPSVRDLSELRGYSAVPGRGRHPGRPVEPAGAGGPRHPHAPLPRLTTSLLGALSRSGAGRTCVAGPRLRRTP